MDYTKGMTEQNFPEHIQAEIKELEARLEAKKRELGDQGRSEKEVFKEIFRERFDELANALPSTPPPSSSLPPASSPKKDDVAVLQKETEVEKLLYLAFEKNPQAAIHEAERMGGGYLVDELHDRLRDEYYDKLVEFRKVDQL
jgi:hypothetical protein